MQNIPTPTTSTLTRTNGETVQITEWTIGAYTLRKAVDPDYTGWTVTTADRNLPWVGYKDGDSHRPIFGVSVPSSGGMFPIDMFPIDALTLAKQITEAAHIAATFGMIAADN